MFLGAVVQTVAGLGIGLLAAPVVALVAPDLVPSLPLFFGVYVAALALISEHRHVDWPSVAWLIGMRVPGTVAGVWLVTVFTASQLGVALAVVVLLAVLLSLRAIELPSGRAALAVAGLLGGVTGSATSVAGPPVALVLQHRPPSEARSTMSVFFTVGASLSLCGLAVAGQLPRASLILGVVMLVPLLAGFAVGIVLRPRLPRERFRHTLLAVCVVSAVALLARSIA